MFDYAVDVYVEFMFSGSLSTATLRPYQFRIQTFHWGGGGGGGGSGHEMGLNVKGTVGSIGGRKLIYNKIITRKI